MLSSEGKQLVSSLWSLTLKGENKSANEMVTLEAEHLTFEGGGGGAGMVGDWRKRKNALTSACRLAYLEIRSRNEEAINSTRNRIYSLKVFYFLLHRRRVFFRIFTFYLFLN